MQQEEARAEVARRVSLGYHREDLTITQDGIILYDNTRGDSRTEARRLLNQARCAWCPAGLDLSLVPPGAATNEAILVEAGDGVWLLYLEADGRTPLEAHCPSHRMRVGDIVGPLR
jgi:hypothetical protein